MSFYYSLRIYIDIVDIDSFYINKKWRFGNNLESW